MPGSDGLRIWVFWETRQLGLGCGPVELESVGDKMPNWEPAADRGHLAPQWPTVEQPGQDEKKVLLGQYSSLSPSSAHLSYTTNITLSRIKCERYIFTKKCVRSFIEVRRYCWLCFPIYLYMYVAIQQVFWIRWSICFSESQNIFYHSPGQILVCACTIW